MINLNYGGGAARVTAECKHVPFRRQMFCRTWSTEQNIVARCNFISFKICQDTSDEIQDPAGPASSIDISGPYISIRVEK